MCLTGGSGEHRRSALGLLAFIVFFAISVAAGAASNYPLKVSADGRYLVDQDGVPFLLVGDSPWSLIVGMTKSEVEWYLADRKSRGFNAILVNLIDTIVGPANREGVRPFRIAGNFSTPNEAYFSHVDWVIRKAAENDIVVLLAPVYLGYKCGNQGWCRQMRDNGPHRLRKFGRYLGRRYRQFSNIVWVEGGDASAGDGGVAAELRALVKGIRERDKVHLHTAHCSRQRSALDCYDEPWLDLNATYSDCAQTPYRLSLDYRRRHLMPFIYLEGVYENEGADPRCLRSQAYWSILGGAAGHVFGNGPIWRAARGWMDILDSPGARSMSRAAAFFRTRPWHLLVPDEEHRVVVSGVGDLRDGTYAATARATDGSTVLVYLPTARRITVDMAGISGDVVRAWWFNPASGDSTVIGKFPAYGKRAFSPPLPGDWVLVLENDAGGTAPPGRSSITR